MSNQIRFITALLAALAGAAFAQAQVQPPNTNPAQFDPLITLGPPTVTITQASPSVDQNNFRILVRWTAQIPNLTQIKQFRVIGEVFFEQGNNRKTSPFVAASAREVTLLLTEAGATNNPPKNFRVFIETEFTTVNTASAPFSDNFTLSQTNNFLDGVKATTATNRVTQVQAANNGNDRSKFDVSWSFNPIGNANINEVRFTVKGDFVYQLFESGTPPTFSKINRSATLTASAGARKIQFSFPGTPKLSTGQKLLNINAAILVTAFFKATQRNQSAPFTGTFVAKP